MNYYMIWKQDLLTLLRSAEELLALYDHGVDDHELYSEALNKTVEAYNQNNGTKYNRWCDYVKAVSKEQLSNYSLVPSLEDLKKEILSDLYYFNNLEPNPSPKLLEMLQTLKDKYSK